MSLLAYWSLKHRHGCWSVSSQRGGLKSLWLFITTDLRVNLGVERIKNWHFLYLFKYIFKRVKWTKFRSNGVLTVYLHLHYNRYHFASAFFIAFLDVETGKNKARSSHGYVFKKFLINFSGNQLELTVRASSSVYKMSLFWILIALLLSSYSF